MKSYSKVLLLSFLFSMVTGLAMAGTAYVTDELQFMVRTGKSTDNKIVAIARSGDRVDVGDTDGDWTYVKLPGGQEGWMLGRFLVPDPPGKVRMVTFEREHERLKQRFAKLDEEAVALREENRNFQTQLSETEKRLESIKGDHEKLKEDSAEFLALKEEATRMRSLLEEREGLVQELDRLLLERNIKMFALGAGVLLVGMVLGISMRKKQKSSFY
ncbi:TIGR04211 family SH3 domain-containing protein [Desulfobotulus sp. H1]|uniref:TIGR04211 family SH3 domain-containing protein n=1 Tax=Desulfobotulus pelophilus TaxID=2823377 RepID=A0ABT3N9B1_9BACT|nr:TIGR04211 family SH3 domain-containing protein [Desulfobotulus pelophilus]MCW7754034.1 TIGR04211 family SH3 domain-containing protein [Desulfobotulus pelophilus]